MEETTSQPQEKKSMNKGIVIVIFIVIIALAIVGYEATKPKNETAQTADSAPAITAPKEIEETPTEEAMTAATYKNGTYNVIGNYTSPGGAEEIDVTMTLEDDVITEAKVISKAFRPTSKEKQADFIANFEPQVIGKKIDEVTLDKVSGSSLTPKGFNDALEKIKEEAQA